MTRAERIKLRAERIKKREEARINEMANSSTTSTTTLNTPIIIDPNRPLNIELCIHCFRYQRRLSWMLSSILQQKGDLPNLIINISYGNNDGTPTTEEVCTFFEKEGLKIKRTHLLDKDTGNRAIGRNIQTKETQADYLLFLDADMIFDIDFFEDLQLQLRGDLKDIKLVMGADRISLKENHCIPIFANDTEPYPRIIKDVANVVSTWPVKWVTGKMVCPGNFQLASVQAIKEKGGVYTHRAKDYWRLTRADRFFRCLMGGRVPINVKKQWHLNHDRGGPEIQR